jgi:hypothetical protein
MSVSMAYAEKTKVAVAETRDEIQRLLSKRGAERFFFTDEPDKAVIGFFLGAMLIKITVPYPRQDAAILQQTKRARWRRLLLIIKARFEAIDSGITTIEREFLADTVMPDGSTVAEWTAPALRSMIERGEMPTLKMLEGPKP